MTVGGSTPLTITSVTPGPLTTVANGATCDMSANKNIPIGPYSATIIGTGLTGATITLGASLTSLSQTNIVVSNTGTQATIWGTAPPALDGKAVQLVATRPDGSKATFNITVGTPGAGTGSIPSWAQASRFLEHAAFGPTQTDVMCVQKEGYNAWLANQFTLNTPNPLLNVNPNDQWLWPGSPAGNTLAFFTAAMAGSDQLRQRVELALSELFVVGDPDGAPIGIPSYLYTLYNDAFGAYFDPSKIPASGQITNPSGNLLFDMTVLAPMGNYLNMDGSQDIPNSTPPILPNQNYAREVMQLFSIGLHPLNLDGSLAAGAPPYSQIDVATFSKAFAGWLQNQSSQYMYPAWAHDTTTPLTLLDYSCPVSIGCYPTIGGSTRTIQGDLQGALTNIAFHPNVAPFVSKSLIKQLVTSNPSPAYVTAVSRAFNSKRSQNIAGDMPTVLTAILTNNEGLVGAGTSDSSPSNPAFGHLREPVLWLASTFRALNASSNNPPENGRVIGTTSSLGQPLYESPSVFNYYAPNNPIPQNLIPSGLPGSAGNAVPNLVGPEFQIQTPATAYARFDFASQLASPAGVIDADAFNYYGQTPASGCGANGAGLPGALIAIDGAMTVGGEFIYDLTPYACQPSIPAMVEAFNDTLTRGAMPQASRRDSNGSDEFKRSRSCPPRTVCVVPDHDFLLLPGDALNEKSKQT